MHDNEHTHPVLTPILGLFRVSRLQGRSELVNGYFFTSAGFQCLRRQAWSFLRKDAGSSQGLSSW